MEITTPSTALKIINALKYQGVPCSCLALAEEYGLKSIAFCCISTGEFRFPNQRAAEIAVKTVREYRKQTGSEIEVIFNVFKDIDDEIYRELLE